MPARVDGAARPDARRCASSRSRPSRRRAAVDEPGGHLQRAGAGRRRPAMQTRSYSLVGAPRRPTASAASPSSALDDGRGGSLAMWRLAAGDRLLVERAAEPLRARPVARRPTCWWPAASASRRWSAWRRRLAALARARRRRCACSTARAASAELAYLPVLQRGAGRSAAAVPHADGAAHRLRRRDRRAAARRAALHLRPGADARSRAARLGARRPRRRPTCASRPSAAAAGCAAQAFRVRIPRHDLRDRGAGRRAPCSTRSTRRRADAVRLPARRVRPVRDGRARGATARSTTATSSSASTRSRGRHAHLRLRVARGRRASCSTRPSGPTMHERHPSIAR